MKTLTPDTELETELQEVYIQATHWLQDISFLETETNFFRNILSRYQPEGIVEPRKKEFELKIQTQETQLAQMKTKIPLFLAFLEPYIGDLKKEMHLDFLDQYNALQNELDTLFAGLRSTKKELFDYTESILLPIKITLP
ncbi:hypothetical protein [Mucilaginibacter sp.]|uniref:hypothetical protein n=1 Tax=Mucilaginibacter sp. TaxID=1882438 RepID=UPI00260B6A61|nr:hypothetical protein [Mucilaginibacter sp.]MDB5032089.1 hypothetical protein [Mucilaginibacter sp.]